MLQYISYLQLCSNVLQNKLSRRQQKYIVNVYKTVQHYGYTFYMIIGSVVFQVMFSERETKCPRLKEKKYTNHVDLTPLKTLGERPRPAEVGRPRPGGRRGGRGAPGFHGADENGTRVQGRPAARAGLRGATPGRLRCPRSHAGRGLGGVSLPRRAVRPAAARSRRSRPPWARRRRAPRSRTGTCARRGPAPAP